MDKMRFTQNWNNKLDCKYFTTIRKYDAAKFAYYDGKLNELDGICIGNENYCSAKLIKIVVCKLSEIDVLLKILDTGTLNYQDVFSKFGLKDNSEVMVLLYERQR